MNKLFCQTISSIFFIALLFGGIVPLSANAATGNELTGKWIHIKFNHMRVEITENGASYVLAEHNERNTKKHVAKLIDGVLVANTGMCALNADIEKKSGNLLFGGQEFRRLKAGESFDYVAPGLPKGY